MRITDIHVEGCGIWRDLALSLPDAGLSVFYGPNEAGKTTLLRFIRGVLFGFPPSLRVAGGSQPAGVSEAARNTIRAAGAIRLNAGGIPYEIRRTARCAGEDELTVGGPLCDGGPAERLRRLLGGCDETLFSHVFALGLHELQELATLESDEVARHIYGMTLGPDARRLLDAVERLRADRETLAAADGRSGRLCELLRRDRELAEALRAEPDLRQRHQQLTRQRRALADRIDELEQRQAGYHSQLRGHVFLDRVYSPWKQVRDCEDELARLPVVSAFPEGGLARLDAIDAERDSLRRCREALQAEAQQFRNQALALETDPAWIRHQATLQSLVEQQPWIEEGARQAAEAAVRVAALEREFAQQRSRLRDDWDDSRLKAVDTSAAAQARLHAAAGEYRAAKARWKTVRRRYDRLNKSTRQREADLAARLTAHGGRSVEQALSAARARLAGLEVLVAQRLREAELVQRARGIDERFAGMEDRPALPRWVYVVLAVFGVFGVVFGLAGLVAGVTTNVLSGAAYAFIGATCGISAWALKTHFETEARERTEQLSDERRANEVALREVRQEIAAMVRDGAVPGAESPAAGDETLEQFHWEGDFAGVPPDTTASAAPAPSAPGGAPVTEDTVDEFPIASVLNVESIRAGAAPVPRKSEAATSIEMDAGVIRTALDCVADLERLAELEQQIRARRRRLTEFRTRLPGVQRQLSAARQAWCETVTRSGLPETVDIRTALDTWRQIAQLEEGRERIAAAVAERDRLQAIVESFRRRVAQLGRQLHGEERPIDNLGATLTGWSEELDAHRAAHAERRRLRHDERRRLREARQYARQITELETRRSALLVQGGAASREEFEQRAEWVARRREFQELLELAQAELDVAARTEPDLAVVEEDLLAFDAAENGESRDMIKLELEDLEREVRASCEELGRLKHEIHELETDRRPSLKRFERAQIEAALIDAAERWCAIDRAMRVVDRMREVFERTCQPETLAAASRYLERLTAGRYRNIWTPLGQRRLSIDDHQGRSFTVEELSGGTREQLFLAVRLATIERLGQGGLALPMVLDDVLVNFDEARTTAAVETLRDFAASGRQVLFFTCHLHLAHLFAARGVEPLWLAGHSAEAGLRRAG